MPFSHFHTSTMVPGRYFSLCLSHCLEQIPWVCPHGPAKSFPKLNKTPPRRGKNKYQNSAIPPGFPWVLRGFPRCQPTGKQMISALISTKFCSSMKTDVD